MNKKTKIPKFLSSANKEAKRTGKTPKQILDEDVKRLHRVDPKLDSQEMKMVLATITRPREC
jgi:hypothetical protein